MVSAAIPHGAAAAAEPARRLGARAAAERGAAPRALAGGGAAARRGRGLRRQQGARARYGISFTATLAIFSL